MKKFINLELFRRVNPRKKQEILNSLNTSELLDISYDAILRVIKEVGVGDPKKRRNTVKTIYLENAGNGLDSEIQSLRVVNKKNEIIMSVYKKGENTDVVLDFDLVDFLNCKYEFLYISDHPLYFGDIYDPEKTALYNRESRARVIKAILNVYLAGKYGLDVESESDGKEVNNA